MFSSGEEVNERVCLQQICNVTKNYGQIVRVMRITNNRTTFWLLIQVISCNYTDVSEVRTDLILHK
jgi:hypothetical protein